MSKLASHVGLCYNAGIKLCWQSDVASILCREHNLVGGYAVDILSPDSSDNNPLEKLCTGPCARMLPATSEYFHRAKLGKYGLASRCKSCTSELMKEYCNRPGIREKRYARNKEYHRNPDLRESMLARKRNYRRRPGIRERWNAYCRARYYSNPKSREQYRIHHVTRRARKNAAPGIYTPAQIQEKLKLQHYSCYYAACGFAKFQKRKNGTCIFHLDHTIPLSRTEAGPRNDINYVVLTCPTCNMKKHNRLPHEFPEGGRLL